jgi:hypothetical protein
MNGKYIFATRLAVLVCISCIALTAGAPTLKSVYQAYSRNVQVFFSLDSPKTGTVTCGAFTADNADIVKVSTCKDAGGSNANCDQGASGICFSCTGSNSFTVTYTTLGSCTPSAQVKCDGDLARHNDKTKAADPNLNLHSKKSVSVYDSKKSLDYTVTLNRLVPGTAYDVFCTMGSDATAALSDVQLLKAELSDVKLNAQTETKATDPAALYFGFINDDALVSQDTIKITQSDTLSSSLFGQYTADCCEIYAQSPGGVSKKYQLSAAYSSTTLTITLEADSDLPIVRGSQVNIKCDTIADLTDNPANENTVVPFNLEVVRHTALTNQLGYMTTAGGSALVTPTLLVDDPVIGNTPASITLLFQLDSSTALASGDTILVEPDTEIFIQDGATTCTGNSGADTSVGSSLTIASLGVTSLEGSGQRLLVMVGGSVTADHFVRIVCTDNLKKNVAGAVTFDLRVSSHAASTNVAAYTTV